MKKTLPFMLLIGSTLASAFAIGATRPAETYSQYESQQTRDLHPVEVVELKKAIIERPYTRQERRARDNAAAAGGAVVGAIIAEESPLWGAVIGGSVSTGLSRTGNHKKVDAVRLVVQLEDGSRKSIIQEGHISHFRKGPAFASFSMKCVERRNKQHCYNTRQKDKVEPNKS